jgi:endonuclease G
MLFKKLIFTAQHLVSALRDQPAPLQSISDSLLPMGLPKSEPHLINIARHGYVSAFDPVALIPKWVCWRVNAATVNKLDVPRRDCFERDKSLPNSPMPAQYDNTGFDLGHMCDCEDMSYSVLTQRESFILSNIAPQAPHFNRGIWHKLENDTRKYVKETGHDVWVLAVSLYDSSCPKLGNIVIPNAFEKMIVDLTTKDVKFYRFAHVSPWAVISDDLNDYKSAQLSDIKL